MITYNEYTEQERYIDETLVFMFNGLSEKGQIDEGLLDSAKGALSYIGNHMKNSSSILGISLRASVGLGQLIMALIKGDEAAVKKHGQFISKQDLWDALSLMDVLLLNLIKPKLWLLKVTLGLDLEGMVIDLINKKRNAEDLVKKKFNDFKNYVMSAFSKDPEKVKRLDSMEHLLFSA